MEAVKLERYTCSWCQCSLEGVLRLSWRCLLNLWYRLKLF